MLEKVGCNANGDVWVSLSIIVGNESQKAVLPLSPDAARWLVAALEEALKQGDQWRKTGVFPDERNRENIDRLSPP